MAGLRLRVIPVIAFIGIFVAVSCAPQGGTPASSTPGASTVTGAAGPTTGGNFRFGQSGDISALDPWNVTDGNSLQVTRQIFESLVDYEPTGFKIVPKLATKWETSSDGKTWTFTLREGVKFHDGTPFDAASVVFNFERARFAKNEWRPTKPVADDFAYYADQWGGYDNDSVITKVEAKDPKTVVFTTATPFGPFLANMAMSAFPSNSPKSVKDDKDGWMLVASKGAAGTGPFVFKPGAWQKDQQITLEKNPSYWEKDSAGRALPYLDKITFRFIKDTAARLAELKAGSIDTMKDFSQQDNPTIKEDANIVVNPRTANKIA